jgi:hypothetical protein
MTITGTTTKNISLGIIGRPNVWATFTDIDTDTIWGLTGKYIYNNSGSLDINETSLNATIDARDQDTTYSNSTGLLLSGTTFSLNTPYVSTLFVNRTDWTTHDSYPAACNSTSFIRGLGDTSTCATDQDTTYSNSTGLNLTNNIFSILSTYRLPQGCVTGEVAKYNTTSSIWECKADDTGGVGSFDLNITNGTTNSSVTDSQVMRILAGSGISVSLTGQNFTITNTGGAAAGNPFNQNLNTTDNVTFNKLTLIESPLVIEDFPLADATPEYWNPVFLEFQTTIATAFDPLSGTAISSGTILAGTGDMIHPGITILRDSATANGGYRIMSDITAFRINGTERARFIFQDRSAAKTTITIRMGFLDTTTVTAPVDGCYLQILNNVLSGICRNNNAQTSTAVNFSNSDNVWYDGRIEVNPTATNVTFSLYNNTQVLLWNQTVTSNIPIASGRETGFGVIATESTTDAAADMLWMDFMNFKMKRRLGR